MSQVPIRPVMLSEQIKEILLEQIVRGDIKPGDRLVESRIAAQMQTSQAPVRDAIRELGMIGIVEMRRNKGAIVRTFDKRELAQIYAVRGELEGMAIEIAAQDPTTAQRLGSKLLELCSQMEDATRRGDIAGFVRLNNVFHRCIVKASDNGPLLEIWDRLDIQSRTAMNVSQSPDRFEQIHADHRNVANAVTAGKAEAARLQLAKHIRSVVFEDGPDETSST